VVRDDRYKHMKLSLTATRPPPGAAGPGRRVASGAPGPPAGKLAQPQAPRAARRTALPGPVPHRTPEIGPDPGRILPTRYGIARLADLGRRARRCAMRRPCWARTARVRPAACPYSCSITSPRTGRTVTSSGPAASWSVGCHASASTPKKPPGAAGASGTRHFGAGCATTRDAGPRRGDLDRRPAAPGRDLPGPGVPELRADRADAGRYRRTPPGSAPARGCTCSPPPTQPH
jgi:hypothetical protein